VNFEVLEDKKEMTHMNLLGVTVKISTGKLETEISRNEIIKETDKSYKMKNINDLLFGCLTFVSKDMIEKIQKGHYGDHINGFERTIWVVDDGNVTERSLIEKLKNEIRKELDNRKIDIDKMISKIG